MPIYEYKCQNGHLFDRFLKISNCGDPQVCECGAIAVKQLSAPAVHVDFPAYQSPASGKWITSRTERREDLKATNCVEYEPSMKDEMLRRYKKEDEALDRKIDEHIEKTIYEMPSEKRDRLVGELEGGIDIQVIRK